MLHVVAAAASGTLSQSEMAFSAASFAEGYSAGFAAAHPHQPATCQISVIDPSVMFNVGIIKRGGKVKWAENNVERASRHFQYGSEWWIHRRLASLPAAKATNTSLAFVATYFSYMHIFAPHLRDRALNAIKNLHGSNPRFIVPHTHPGTCAPQTRHMVRMCVDTDLACGDSTMVVPVPYVVSFPVWLVAAELPQYPRTTWLFFRGHLPKSYIDRMQVRRRIIETLKTEPNVSVVPANVKPGAKYSPHDEYLQQMLRAKFCFAPRGDTASAKRLYESIAAGCIPIIVSDRLRLPYQRQMDWSTMSLRYSERVVAADPRKVLRDVQAMAPERIEQMQRNLMAVRPMFLWHTDETRKSAVDYVIHDLCAWEHAQPIVPPS